jgi:hypothetical protein
MRMDLTKARYANFDELYDYCYKVAGAVGLMTTPVMGVDPSYKVSFIFPYCYMYHHHITAYIYMYNILYCRKYNMLILFTLSSRN